MEDSFLAYLVLARKWRPFFFRDIVGQETIVKILQNAIKQKRIAHAYLFSGPRGVGKTTTARILAKALNCDNGPATEPCGQCNFCKGINTGSLMDVVEIDGASNNSVEDVRNLREAVKYAPSGAKYKIYIIDEAHMLTTAAFNALLKTLEEPPPNVIFIMATTSPNKVISTVLSRCQHLPFRRIPAKTIESRLKDICKSEGFEVSGNALKLIAEAADGCLRDSQTLLDQVLSFTSKITEEDVKALLGLTDRISIINIVYAILTSQRKTIIESIDEIYETGTDLKMFLGDLINVVRDTLVLKETGLCNGSELEKLCSFNSETLIAILNELFKAENIIKFSSSSRIAIEMSLLKMTYFGEIKPINTLIKEMETLVKGEISEGKPHQQVLSVSQSTEQSSTIKETEHNINQQDMQNKSIAKEVESKNDASTAQKPESVEQSLIKTNKNKTSENLVIEKPKTESLHADKDINFIHDVLKRINEENHLLGAKISTAKPTLEEKTVWFLFEGGNDIHVDCINTNKKYIEQVIHDITGQSYNVQSKSDKTKKITRKPVKEPSEERPNSPLIQEALDLFGGKIVDIKPIKKKKK